MVASPGSTVKFDLQVTAPAVTVAQLTVDQVPTGWKTTLRGGGFVVNAVTASPDTPGKVTVEVVVPPDAAADNYSLDIVAADGSGQRKRLGDVVVGTAVEGVDDVELAVTSGHNDDRSTGMTGTQLFAELRAIAIGEAEVDEGDVVIIGSHGLCA